MLDLMTHYNPNPTAKEWLLRRKVGQRFTGYRVDVSGTIVRAMYYLDEPFFLIQRHPSQPKIWVHATRDKVAA